MAIEGEVRKLADCRKEQDSLAREMKHPNKSRLPGAQIKLV
jgi:hypothetical protein